MTSTTTLDFSPMVSLAEAIDLIVACPDNIFFLQAPPGCGKSYTHTQMRKHPALQGHLFPSIVDVPNLDIGDTAMPVVDKEKMLTNYAPNARFQLTQGKPVVLCLDEFSIAIDPVTTTAGKSGSRVAWARFIAPSVPSRPNCSSAKPVTTIGNSCGGKASV